MIRLFQRLLLFSGLQKKRLIRSFLAYLVSSFFEMIPIMAILTVLTGILKQLSGEIGITTMMRGDNDMVIFTSSELKPKIEAIRNGKNTVVVALDINKKFQHIKKKEDGMLSHLLFLNNKIGRSK